MYTMMKVAFSVLRSQWRVVILMIVFFGVTVFALLLLAGYRDNALRLFQTLDQEYLVVLERDTLGEFYGSQIGSDIGDQLLAAGCSKVVPAIHTATGTAGRNYQFVLGVDVEQYKTIQPFELVEGRILTPNDPENLAMVGKNLADTENIKVGRRVELRGRYFDVIGIFDTRTFANNEVWVSLAAAQNLLGWESDVSYFLVPDEGVLEVGSIFMDNTVVKQRGESIASATKEYLNILDHFSMIVLITGFGTAFAFGNIIFRLAAIQRYELAVLRTMGFSQIHMNFNFIFQSLFIFLSGFSLALLAALIFPHLYQISIFDLTIQPDLSIGNILWVFIILLLLGIISMAVPMIWFNRANINNLLRSE